MMVAKPSKKKFKNAGSFHKQTVRSVHLENCPAVIVPVDYNLGAALLLPSRIASAAAGKRPGQKSYHGTHH